MSDRENGRNPRQKISRRGINLWAAMFIVIGIALMYFSHTETESVGPAWLHFAESLGHALFIFGLISVFLELRDFTEYVSCVLQEQLLDRQYIRKLGAADLQGLKRDVDEVLVGATGLMSPGSFYEFIDQHFDALIRAPYRTRMIEISDYAYDGIDRSRLWKSSTTTYNFVKGFSGNTPMIIRWSWTCLPLDSHTAREQVRNVVISFTLRGRKHTYKLVKPALETDPMILISEAGAEIKIEESLTALPMKVPAVQFGFQHVIPESSTFGPSEKVSVEIRDDVLIDAVNDNYSSLRVSYPTHGLIVEANFPSDVNAHQVAHGFSPHEAEPMVERNGKCFMNIDRWCLPGHGIVTIWHLPSPHVSNGKPTRLSSSDVLTMDQDVVKSSRVEMEGKS